MQSLKNILLVLSAIAWLGSTVHCRLEALSGFEFLACLTETGCHDEPGSDQSDDGCCSIEKSEYKISQIRQTLPAPDLVLLDSTPVPGFVHALAAEVSVGVLTAAPPQWLKTWQFASRTALPVRAPSIAS